MSQIQVLDPATVDKIAAGEVIDRPASVVKELVENAIDAGADTITVEIEDGGISLIRVQDNGIGIAKEDVRHAFLRHATSKIKDVDDLSDLSSLGFRGEALSSIAAVTKVEMTTKTAEEELGVRIVIEGGVEQSFEEVGATNGTIFCARQLFYNVPARRKFLKSDLTEASHIQTLLTSLALSHPEISFLFLNHGQEKLRTAGNGRLKDVIYALFGKEMTENLLDLDFEHNGIHIEGYLGKPAMTRGNRNFEFFYVNGRYIHNQTMGKALEDAYKDYIMQHRFPFAVIHLSMPGEKVDVNVHPSKMELKFQRQQDVYDAVFETVHRRLSQPELIQQVTLPSADEVSSSPSKSPFSLKKDPALSEEEQGEKDEEYFIEKMKERVYASYEKATNTEEAGTESDASRIQEEVSYDLDLENAKQMDLFEESFLKRDDKPDYQIIGQVFDTYWLVQFQDNLYIIDQHAAHERVLYERTMKAMRTREFTSQYISPPIILNLNMQEMDVLEKNLDRFQRIGFEMEPFGDNAYAVSAVPDNLFSIGKQELLIEMLDELADDLTPNMTPDLIDEKVASMSCKAAVKGNNHLSEEEADALIGELLQLDNPYHCPHGRPTIIAMSKRELEKRFKRIV